MSTLLQYPRYVALEDPAGSTLTRSSVVAMTPDKIEAMGLTAYHEAIWSRMTESRAVGVVPNTLHELLMSRIAPIEKGQLAKKTVGRTTKFAPFKYRTRKRNMAMSMFNVAAGEAHPTAGAGGIPASAWNLTINLGPGQFATAYKNLARFFPIGHYISVEHKNVATGVAYNSMLKVIAKSDVDADTATLTVVPPYTAAGWAALDADAKAKNQPQFGAVTVLWNNISDYEAFAVNAPTDSNDELIVDWFGTSREARHRTLEYEKYLQEILAGNVNEYLRRFKYLAPAERNKQEMAYWQSVFLNAAWFNQRINQYQTVDPTWDDIENLDTVVDPEDAGIILDRKANPLGIHTQLVENGRRIDLQGGDLDFDMLLELFYVLRRNRKLDGKSHETIDLMTDRVTKDQLDQVLTRFLQDTYQYNTTRLVQSGQVVVDGTNIVAFEYTVYELPRQHLKIAIFTHEFFDDRLTAFGDGTGGLQGSVNNRARGRMIAAIDWDDFFIGILETNQVKREYVNDVTAQANPTYTTRMKLNTREYDLRSTTWDVEFGDYERHLIIENYSDNCPKLTSRPCFPSS